MTVTPGIWRRRAAYRGTQGDTQRQKRHPRHQLRGAGHSVKAGLTFDSGFHCSPYRDLYT